MLLLGFSPNALCAELNEVKGEPLIIPSSVYMYTVLGFSDLFSTLNLRTLSTWGMLSFTSKGGSFLNISSNLSTILVVI